jgi:suppressor of G2 allele of SKP1
MKKPEAVRWEKLEGQGDEPTPKQFTAGLYPGLLKFTVIV